MTHKASLIDNYEEHMRDLNMWQLQIILYRFGEKHVCIVNNLDPGATICRVSGHTREEALRVALEEANRRLSQTALAPPSTVPAHASTQDGPMRLGRIDRVETGETVSYSIPEFLELPLQTRMEYILSGNLRYFLVSNQEVPAEVAMKLLGKERPAAARAVEAAAA